MTMSARGQRRVRHSFGAAIAALVLSVGAWSEAQPGPLVDGAGDVREDAYDHLRRALLGSDTVYAPIDKEAPSVQLIRSPEHKHTDGDVATLVPAAGLEAVARAFAKIIDGVNTLDLVDLQPVQMRSAQ